MRKSYRPPEKKETQAKENFSPRAMSFFLGLCVPHAWFDIKEGEKKTDEVYPSDIDALIKELKSIHESTEEKAIYVPCLPSYDDLKADVIKKGVVIGLEVVRQKTGIKMHEQMMNNVIARLEELKRLVGGYHIHTKFHQRFSAIHDLLSALYAYTASQLPHERLRHLDLSVRANDIKTVLDESGSVHVVPLVSFEKAFAKVFVEGDAGLLSNLSDKHRKFQLTGECPDRSCNTPDENLSEIFDWVMTAVPVTRDTLDPEKSVKHGFRVGLAMYVNNTAWPAARKHLQEWIDGLPNKDPAIIADEQKVLHAQETIASAVLEAVQVLDTTDQNVEPDLQDGDDKDDPEIESAPVVEPSPDVSVDSHAADDNDITDQEFLQYALEDDVPNKSSEEAAPDITCTVRYIDMETMVEDRVSQPYPMQQRQRQWVAEVSSDEEPDGLDGEETDIDSARRSYFNLEDMDEQYANPCLNAMMIFL